MKNAIVFDSSGWIEFFTGGPLANLCEKEIQGASRIIVPTTVIYEVYKKIRAREGETQALEVIATLSTHSVVDLSTDIALAAAEISLTTKLPMADSVLLAHSRYADARLVTLDNDFAGLDEVKILR